MKYIIGNKFETNDVTYRRSSDIFLSRSLHIVKRKSETFTLITPKSRCRVGLSVMRYNVCNTIDNILYTHQKWNVEAINIMNKGTWLELNAKLETMSDMQNQHKTLRSTRGNNVSSSVFASFTGNILQNKHTKIIGQVQSINQGQFLTP